MAASTDIANTVWRSLEPELECFICQEILYQPLKLIDCLHSFCGACLKEWFSHQYGQATSSRSSSSTSNPYTCPTCRANVKDAKHDATVYTLVEKFLAANPHRLRTQEDIERMAGIYKPGDSILPKVESRRRERRTRRDDDGLEARERRMVEEARERSLRDMHSNNVPSQTTLQPPSSRQSHSSRSREREQRRERRREQDRQERRHRAQAAEPERGSEEIGDQDQQRRESTVEISPPINSPRHPEAVEARQRQQTVVHQASLISLISNSDSSTNSRSHSSNADSLNEESVKQLILELGLLDGVDIDAMTEAEQETFAETLADSVRRWQRNQRNNPASEGSANGNALATASHMGQSTSDSRTDESRRNRRRQSEGRQRPADIIPARLNDLPLAEQGRTVRSPSAIDIHTPPLTSRSERSQTSNSANPLPPTSSVVITHRRRASSQGQRREKANTSPRHSSPAERLTDSRTRSITTGSNRTRSQDRAGSREANVGPSGQSSTDATTSSPNLQVRFQEPRNLHGTATIIANRTEPAVVASEQSRPSSNQAPAELARSDHVVSQTTTQSTLQNPTSTRRRASGFFDEPTITCFKCYRADIQYEVYRHCGKCEVNLCCRCYREGRGCKHWCGFGNTAIVPLQPSSNGQIEPPHTLATGRQYQRPEQHTVVRSKLAKDGVTVIPLQTTSDPASRFQEGRFCDRCGKFANSLFWLCEQCNHGEWGFCNDCVDTHHCCTHPLLPTVHTSCASTSSTSRPNLDSINSATNDPSIAHANQSPSEGQPSSTIAGAANLGSLPTDLIPILINTTCDICSQTIPRTSLCFHCPFHPLLSPDNQESHGKYDICAPCYQKLVMTNRIKRDDGSAGWRKCPSGHRMVITTFQPDDEEEEVRYRRVVVNDLVGGWKSLEEAMKDWNAELEHLKEQASGDSPTSPTSSDGVSARRFMRSRTGSSSADQSAPGTASPFSSSSKFPPDGGSGPRGIAQWSHFPDEADHGQIKELTFPWGADIKEIKFYKDYPDWCYGVYAGDRGLVPMGYLKIYNFIT